MWKGGCKSKFSGYENYIGGFAMNNLTKNRVYHAAIYVRLSKEDGDKEQSDSIRNQRDLTRNYLADTLNMWKCKPLI